MGGKHIHNELKLVIAAQKDRRYFKALYTKYYEQIYLFILRRCADSELAADLTQQCFIKAMINLAKFEFRGLPFSAWLYRIALNEVNLHFRDNAKKRSVALDENTLSEFSNQMGENEETQDRMPILVKALNTLSEPELAMVEMKFFEKRSHAEIGLILGISESNTKVRLHRIIKKMRDAVQNVHTKNE